MKRHYSTLLCVIALFTAPHAHSTPIFDSFDSSVLSDQWVTIRPYGYSSVSVTNGELTTLNRGKLVTSAGYLAPYTISGVFAMHDSIEHFNIALRTDLTSFGSSDECSGLIVTFVNDGQGICIQQYESLSDQWQQIAYTPYVLTTDQSYLFSLTDMGNSVSLSLDGVSILTAQTDFATGDHISFYSREFGGGTSIDSLSIIDMGGESASFRLSQAPDSGASGLLMGCGLIGLLAARRLRAA